MPSGEELKDLRIAILTAKNAASTINFDEDVSKSIEEDYVNDRKTRPEYGQDQFKLVLSLTKYVSIFEGAGKPDIKSYLRAKSLVLEMMARERTRYPPSSTKASNIR